MRFSSALLTKVAVRRRRFLFCDFFVRKWLLFARIRRIFPDPVRRRRLAAPRLVFIFGISYPFPGALGRVPHDHSNQRRQYHRHDSPLETRQGFHLPHVLQVIRDAE